MLLSLTNPILEDNTNVLFLSVYSHIRNTEKFYLPGLSGLNMLSASLALGITNIRN